MYIYTYDKLDTSSWDIHNITWQCYKEFGQKPEIILNFGTDIDGRIEYRFEKELDSNQLKTLENMNKDSSVSVLPTPTHKFEIVWDIDAIMKQLKAIGINIMYVGKPDTKGTKAAFYIIDTIDAVQEKQLKEIFGTFFTYT